MAAERRWRCWVLPAAGMFFESFRDTAPMDPGFQVEGVLLSAYIDRRRRLWQANAQSIRPSPAHCGAIRSRLRALEGRVGSNRTYVRSTFMASYDT